MVRIVVDTSVWSLVFRRRAKHLSATERAMVHHLREMITDGRAIMLGAVRQELLTGIADRTTFETVQTYLHEIDDLPPDIDDYERAAAFANLCHSGGIATTPVDMLVCSMAAGRDLPIFTSDLDFDRYRQCVPIQLFNHP